MTNRADAICEPAEEITCQACGSRPALESRLTRTASAGFPGSGSIIEAFTDVGDDPSYLGPGAVIVGIARELAVHHQRQWHAEDVTRLPGTRADDVAASKRLIDELNARRVALVEQIDAWAVRETRSVASASLHTETLGSVVDRLAIAWVRSSRLARTADAPRALRQLAELAGAYDDLVRDIAAGRRRLPAWRPLKSYRGMP